MMCIQAILWRWR